MKYDKKEPKESVEGPAVSLLPMPDGDQNDRTHYYQLGLYGNEVVLYCRDHPILAIAQSGEIDRYSIHSSIKGGFVTTQSGLIKIKE